jgi:allantoinase
MPDRDLIGYGGRPPHPNWPGNARVAVQFVLNLEEGAESTIVNGDSHSEAYLHDLPGREARENERDLSVEGLFEYGSRAGLWRILELFRSRGIKLTVFACGRVLELYPALGRSLVEAGHEIAGHGYRWLDYRQVPEDIERQHIAKTIAILQQTTGIRPIGWYTGRTSPNTRRLLLEEGGFHYSSDAYNDDLPYWLAADPRHLVIPYTLVNNDMRYLIPNGFANGDDFFIALRDSYDCLWLEGENSPKLMSVGLHARISGQPARAMALARFMDYILVKGNAWICRRDEIAHHWHANFKLPLC